MTGRARIAVLAGFWCGVVLAVVAAVGLLLRDLVLAERLARPPGAWIGDLVGDATCNGVSGLVLADCEIGDAFGAGAAQMLVGPVLGALLAGLAGSLTATSRVNVTATLARTAASPLVFCAIMLILFGTEATLKLW